MRAFGCLSVLHSLGAIQGFKSYKVVAEGLHFGPPQSVATEPRATDDGLMTGQHWSNAIHCDTFVKLPRNGVL